MKKAGSIIFSFIILLAAAGFAFYTGWTQFKIPEGCSAILVSKTGGVNEKVMPYGDFSWHWEFLLPTNASLKVFRNEPYSARKAVKGSLPSAGIYSKVLKDGSDFSYSFTVSCSLRVPEDCLVNLVKDAGIKSDDELSDYLSKSASVLIQAASDSLVKNMIESDSASVDTGRVLKEARELYASAAAGNMADVDIISLSITDVTVPDMAVYGIASKAYADYLGRLSEVLLSRAEAQAAEISEFNQTLSKLEKIGETLKKYPELTEVLKNSNNINSILQTINSMQ